jgi:hypothetical protein
MESVLAQSEILANVERKQKTSALGADVLGVQK